MRRAVASATLAVLALALLPPSAPGQGLTGYDGKNPFDCTLQQGGPFLTLPYEKRVAAVLSGLSFDNGSRTLWEAAAAVPFTAFCAAAVHPVGTSANASGYRVMGYPGAAPNGYASFSYRRRLARERTRRGNLR